MFVEPPDHSRTGILWWTAASFSGNANLLLLSRGLEIIFSWIVYYIEPKAGTSFTNYIFPRPAKMGGITGRDPRMGHIAPMYQKAKAVS